MVFSADDRVLIKVLRQEKGHGAKNSSQNFPASEIWGELQGVSQPDSWRWPAEVTPDRRVGTFPPGIHRWSDQAVASTSSSFHSSTRRTFWTHTLVMFDICTDVHFDSHMTVRLPIVHGHFCFGGDLTKPSITIASVDRLYLNLVICLQLDIALLVQNSVKIWHCLSELWQYIQGVTFFVDTVYIRRAGKNVS